MYFNVDYFILKNIKKMVVSGIRMCTRNQLMKNYELNSVFVPENKLNLYHLLAYLWHPFRIFFIVCGKYLAFLL